MKTRSIPKQFETQIELGYKNLLVSGCSFTYNNSDEHSCTWPYYLRDLGGFDTVYDCSLPAAGNQHIHNSLIYAIDQHQFDSAETFVIVLWSGNDRDDVLCNSDQLSAGSFRYFYDTKVELGYSGGTADGCGGNLPVALTDQLKTIKSVKSRAVENYIYISGLYNFLSNLNYPFLMLEYRDFALPARDQNFDLREHLPPQLVQRVDTMITNADENFYRFCVRNDYLSGDDYHPTPNGHLSWTREILLPMLSKKS